MGRAASEIIGAELQVGATAILSAAALHSSPFAQYRPISTPGASAEQAAAMAEGATRIILGQVLLSQGKLSLAITERDPVSQKTLQAFSVSSSSQTDLFGLADAAAHRLSSPGTTALASFGSKNNEAIRAFTSAIETPDPQQAKASYAHAVQADPGFASAWLAWLNAASSRGDRAEVQQVFSGAQQNAARFSDLDRARLKFTSAKFTGDRAAMLAASNELVRLRPDDPDNLVAVAELSFAQRQFAAAAADYRRLVALQPTNSNAWNQLGYSLLYAGDEAGATAALQKYRQILPKDANALDSQGDVAFAFGHFAAAEKLYRQATQLDPAFGASGDLLKAAQARLMTGDLAGADKNFDLYAAARRDAHDPSLPLRTAEWRYLSGKHDQAVALLGALATDPAATPPLKSAALSQLAIWDLLAGRRDRALQESSAALQTGAPSTTTLVARFSSEKAATPAAWSALADKLFASPQVAAIKPLALAYALYFDHQWQAAEPIWKQIVDSATPDDIISQAVYARILVELKRSRDAEPLVRLFPIPHVNAVESLLSVAIPQILETRAAVFDAMGKSADAASNRALFKTLSR